MFSRIALTVLVALSLGACAISDEPSFASGGEGGDAVGGAGGAEASGEPGSEGEGEVGGGESAAEEADARVIQPCGEATGEPTFRFDSLKLTEPASLSGLLGGLLSKDIDGGELNILIELNGLEAGGDSFSVRGGGAAECEGNPSGYTWDSTTPSARPSDLFPATLDDDRKFEIGDDDAVLFFPLTLLGASVRLDRLRVEAQLSVGEDVLTEGKIAGYITRSVAEVISVSDVMPMLPEGTSLADVLPENRVETDICPEDCWLLSSDFSAALTTQHAAP